ncbi:MAG TPA: hypothetical protein VHX14_11240 [Thermoanaerobaculia bacterium]|jgi:hypothetical protein|nr:hypothetical protein [Thermoanaerobaculia bacterium]
MATTKKTKRRRPAAKPAAALSADVNTAEEKFNRDLLIRGEAAVPDANGNLPLDATHEIVTTGKGKNQQQTIQRRRFKMF